MRRVSTLRRPLPVAGLMSKRLVTAEPLESLADAARRMRDERVGCVAVTEGDRLVGVLTERDLLRAMADGLSPRIAPVAEYMTPNPYTVEAGEDIFEAAAIMVGHGIRHVPVLEDGRLAGVVSVRDLLSHDAWAEAPPVAVEPW